MSRRAPATAPVPITVPIAELEAVARWTSTDEKRPHLHLIAFRSNYYTACDGHRLVRVPCATNGHSFGIHRCDVEAAVAAHATQRRFRSRMIDLLPLPEPGQSGFAATATAVNVAMQIRPPPNLLRILAPLHPLDSYPLEKDIELLLYNPDSVRDGKGIAGYNFNPQFLAAIAEVHAADAGSDENGNRVQIETWSSQRDGGVTFRNPKGIQFLVMPMRV